MERLSPSVKILLLMLLLSSALFSQRLLKLTVSIGDRTEYVPYIVRNGMVFTSAKELAKVVSGNYYYNPESAKLELKFPNYTLKVTARNQFIILTHRKTGNKHVYQIPISTRLVKGDVFIPIKYSLLYINLAAETEIVFNNESKHLTVTENSINSLAFITSPPRERKPVSNITPGATQPSSESKYDVYGLNIMEKANGTLIRINSGKKLSKYSSSITGTKLYLFLSGVSVDPKITDGVKPAGLVREINKREVSGNTQLEFDLREGFAAQETFQDISSNDILITVHNEKFNATETDLSAEKEKWIFDTIVIDAGHGGKDPGAIGVTGTREKDINLGISKKLGNIFNARLPEVKVVYTRDNDEFVELYKRGKIANEAEGKLFISIHCNSMPKKPSSTNGFEVYLLRPGRTKEAISIAEFENSVIKYEENPDRYQKLTDENFILVSMAHSAYMRYSEKFSDLLNNYWTRNVKIKSRGVKQAGFYVLVGASMPSVLIEAGFLSNREDERYLKSGSGQQEIAQAIFSSVLQYKNYYDESFKETE